MAGYKPPRKVYELEFVDYPGLEVHAIGASLQRALALGKVRIDMDGGVESAKEGIEFIMSRIVRWNLLHPDVAPADAKTTDTGDLVCAQCGMAPDTPMPVTTSAMYCLQPDMVVALIRGWMVAVTSISGPKEPNSENGSNLQKEVMNQLGALQNPLPSPKLS